MFRSVFSEEMQAHVESARAEFCKTTYLHKKAALRLFDDYLVSVGLAEKELTEEVVNGWIGSLECTARTLCEKVTNVRSFIGEMIAFGYRCYLPVSPKYPHDYVPKIFSDEELAKITNDADEFLVTGGKIGAPYLRYEYPVILRLLQCCGMRLHEAISIRVGDVDLGAGVITLRETKSKRERLVPLHPKMADILGKYIRFIGVGGSGASFLFPGKDADSPLTNGIVAYPFNQSRKRHCLDREGRSERGRGACIHCLRHTFAFKSFSTAAERGVAVELSAPFLSKYLGHRGLSETEAYLKFSCDQAPEATAIFESRANGIFPEVDLDEE